MSPVTFPGEPAADCALCPRLAAFRAQQRAAHPDWFNAPVPILGDPQGWLAIVGLAPGLKGANRTGRAFTGDGSGVMLFDVLIGLGLAQGHYGEEPGDGLRLDGALIVNAVRSVPPVNKPTPTEVRACRPYLAAPLAASPGPSVIVTLGRIAHEATLAVLGETSTRFRFAHGAEHRVGSVMIVNSYHCSRYNQNTGRLTHKMLWSAFETALRYAPPRLLELPKNIGISTLDPHEKA